VAGRPWIRERCHRAVRPAQRSHPGCAGRRCVEIFAAPESKHHTDTKESLRYLSWHGIAAARFPADEATGLNLLAQASAIGGGLIVMGAYTHGHYRQFLFGGMTRHVMEHAAVPVLLAH